MDVFGLHPYGGLSPPLPTFLHWHGVTVPSSFSSLYRLQVVPSVPSFSWHCSIGSRAAYCPMLSHIGVPGDGGGVGGGDGLGDGGGDGEAEGGGDGEAEGGGDGFGDGGGDGDADGGLEHPMQIGTYPLPEN